MSSSVKIPVDTNKAPYQFPATVRLMGQPAFASRAIDTLQGRLQHKPTPQLYQLLVDAYRRVGDLTKAAHSALQWCAFEPDNITARYLSCVLNQQPLTDMPVESNTIRAAPYRLVENFLSYGERDYFWQKATHSETAFTKAGMGVGSETIIDCSQRDTNVLKLEKSEKSLFKSKIALLKNELFNRFQMPTNPIKKIEAKLTAHGQGGFFRIHQDGLNDIRSTTRQVSWIYFFHAHPKPFKGGNLILFDSDCKTHLRQYSLVNYTQYTPQNNYIIFFPSRFYHGVTPVQLLRPGIISSRFAITGHIHC